MSNLNINRCLSSDASDDRRELEIKLQDVVPIDQYFTLLRSVTNHHKKSLNSQQTLMSDIVELKRKLQPVVTETPLQGICLEFLLDLHKLVKETDKRSITQLTTEEVWKDYVLPLTLRGGASVTDLINAKGDSSTHPIFNRPHHSVGKANIFVSHTWGGSFHELILTLKRVEAHSDYEDVKNKKYWVDILSVNQFQESHFQKTFANAIAQVERTVCILWPWDDPRVLTRCWCLWEIFCSMEAEVDVDFVMSEKQEEELLKVLYNDFRSRHTTAVWTAVSSIDAQKATALRPEDEIFIKESIRNGPGFATINNRVLSCMKNLLAEMVQTLAPRIKTSLRMSINAAKFLSSLDRLEYDPFQSDNVPSYDTAMSSSNRNSSKHAFETLGKECMKALGEIVTLQRKEYIRRQKQASIRRYKSTHKNKNNRRFKSG